MCQQVLRFNDIFHIHTMYTISIVLIGNHNLRYCTGDRVDFFFFEYQRRRAWVPWRRGGEANIGYGCGEEVERSSRILSRAGHITISLNRDKLKQDHDEAGKKARSEGIKLHDRGKARQRKRIMDETASISSKKERIKTEGEHFFFEWALCVDDVLNV